MRLVALCLTVAFVAACSQGETTAPTAPTGAPTEAVAPPPPPPAAEEPAYVTGTTGLLRSPTEDKKVTDPKTSKEVFNWITTLLRGDQITAVKQEGDYMQVRDGSGQEGWVKAQSVLLAEGVSLATVLEEAKTFNGPDFAKLDPKKTLLPGTVLFVTKSMQAFSEVNYAGTQKKWVLSEKLSADPTEIEAAKLVSKARSLDEKKDPSAQQFWDLAKTQFATTKLVQALGSALTPEAAPSEASAQAAEQPQ